jgi:two-component system, NtrC family, sensor kinase
VIRQLRKRLDLHLISVTLAVTALIMLATGFYTIITEKEILLKQIDIEGMAIANATSIYSIEPLLIHDYPILETYATNIVRKEYHIGSLEIIRQDGKKVVSEISSDGKEAINGGKIRFYEKEVYPYQEADNSIGTVKIGILTQQYLDTIEKRTITVILQLVISFISLIAVLFLLIKRLVGKPLTHLDSAVTALGTGDLDTEIRISSSNELGNLAENIDQMRINLNGLYRDLRETNSELDTSQKEYKDLAENLEMRVNQQVKTIEETQKQLYQSEKLASVGHLAAGMAHEINNPISFILSNSSTLKEYTTTLSTYISALETTGQSVTNSALKDELDVEFILEDIFDLVESNLMGLYRVQEIVQSLRNFSHIDDSKNILYTEIKNSVKATLAVIQSEKTEGVEVVTIFNDSTPAECNPSLLNQALLNLIENSFHAVEISSNPSKKVTISTHEDSDSLYCEIEDSGDGIPLPIQEHIFSPFFTTKSVGEGKGLGLYSSYDIIVNIFKGSLTFSTVENDGTTFTIRIPKSK